MILYENGLRDEGGNQWGGVIVLIILRGWGGIVFTCRLLMHLLARQQPGTQILAHAKCATLPWGP